MPHLNHSSYVNKFAVNTLLHLELEGYVSTIRVLEEYINKDLSIQIILIKT